MRTHKSLKTAALSLGSLGVGLILAACNSPSPSSAPSPAPAAGSSPTTSASAGAGTSASAATGAGLTQATATTLANPTPDTPADLAERLQQGGLVIVHRYTGATRPGNPDPAPEGFIDDGQRISEQSVERMRALGQQYEALGIPVNEALSSEYYFVYQHASEAMGVIGQEVTVNRDLTGSLNFQDPNELEESLQGLRNRTVTAPPAGTNTVLFTHQGKFDKAWGYYPDAGWTLVFSPDGTGEPQVIASLPLDEFLALG
ncbi:hypothetical protein [Corynebacterium kozikiae]|uniref:hypothetical protein n=1 Tax=Corynebacterium kozikiae TaxID=2968469 RepID=UPI00211CB7DE|nr:hypothetical protein [Corynebacterium sp. 76QC2CO]MCQ9344128.1 hypothetical protein [Corynebacterium sp. 76QC2CO]